MSIHPTAVIDPGAQIGSGVAIGPYCIIGAQVSIGPDCWLQNHVTVCGPVRIGAGNRFHAFCSIGQQTQDLKYAGEPTYLEIGEGNCFREFVTVNRATAAGSVTRVVIGAISWPTAISRMIAWWKTTLFFQITAPWQATFWFRTMR